HQGRNARGRVEKGGSGPRRPRRQSRRRDGDVPDRPRLSREVTLQQAPSRDSGGSTSPQASACDGVTPLSPGGRGTDLGAQRAGQGEGVSAGRTLQSGRVMSAESRKPLAAWRRSERRAAIAAQAHSRKRQPAVESSPE